jgi:glycosyltransferase involved in cell wall biosynthesis
VSGLLSAMDMLAAPSAQETFGLSVIEALAAGLPVAYTSCPALDDLPAGSTPAAIRVSTDRADLRRTVLAAIRAGPRRLAPPAEIARYDIARVASRIHELYERVVHTSTEEEQ